MDSTKSGQENRDFGPQDSSIKQETGNDDQTIDRSTETPDSQPTPKVESSWLHDQSISFNQLKSSLEMLKNAVQEAIDKDKEELLKYTSVRDSLK